MILWDASHALYRNIHMNVDKLQDNPEFVSHLLLQSILFTADGLGASRHNPLIIALDSPSWRKKWYEDNKTQFIEYRNETYKGRRSKDDSIPWDDIFTVYNSVMEGLESFSDFHVMKVANAEADDIIAVCTKEAKKRGETVWIVSSDKDFLQLQDEGKVNIYDSMKKQWKPTVDVERFKKYHTILGDKSDNILPIKKGVGEKTAEKMLKELDMLLQTNHEMKAKYEFNKTLIDFDYIPKEVYDAICVRMDKQSHCYNQMELLKLFSKYRLNKMTDNINKFKLQEGPLETKLNTVFKAKNAVKNIQNQTLEDFFS